MFDELLSHCHTIANVTNADMFTLFVLSYMFGVFCAGLGDTLIRFIKKKVKGAKKDELQNKH